MRYPVWPISTRARIQKHNTTKYCSSWRHRNAIICNQPKGLIPLNGNALRPHRMHTKYTDGTLPTVSTSDWHNLLGNINYFYEGVFNLVFRVVKCALPFTGGNSHRNMICLLKCFLNKYRSGKAMPWSALELCTIL